MTVVKVIQKSLIKLLQAELRLLWFNQTRFKRDFHKNNYFYKKQCNSSQHIVINESLKSYLIISTSCILGSGQPKHSERVDWISSKTESCGSFQHNFSDLRNKQHKRCACNRNMKKLPVEKNNVFVSQQRINLSFDLEGLVMLSVMINSFYYQSMSKYL